MSRSSMQCQSFMLKCLLARAAPAEYTVAIGCGLLCKQFLCQQPHNNLEYSMMILTNEID